MEESDRLKIQSLYQLGRKLEIEANDDERSEFREQLRNFSCEQPNWQFLHTIGQRIQEDFSDRLLADILGAIERQWELSLADPDLGYNSQDRNASEAKFPMTIILDNLRSAYNVGAIFRNADCMGASEVFLCGYTATPQSDKVKKTTMGTSDWISWRSFTKVTEAINVARSQGHTIVAVETSAGSEDLYATKLPAKVALVFGNERHGLAPSTLDLCDQVISIPTYGRKNSLNVGTAMALVGYRYLQDQVTPKLKRS